MPANAIGKVLLASSCQGRPLKLGVSGHQERPGIDWSWVHAEILSELKLAGHPLYGLSSLAKGADQVFANAILERGGRLISVIPLDGYERYFEGDMRDDYFALVRKSTVVRLHGNAEQEAFLNAGKYIAEKCDLLLAIWDAQPAQGKGGTAEVVEYARCLGRPWVHIDPLKKVVIRHT